MNRAARRLYGDLDPREAPAYPITEAAQFLWVPEWAIRRWSMGAHDRKAVIRVADPQRRLLSFMNLAELHVLSFLRDQQVQLQEIRRGIEYICHEVGDHPHPLLALDLVTDGASVFIQNLQGRKDQRLINASRHGQLAMRALLEAHLKRIDRDAKTLDVLRLYPFAWRVRSPEDAAAQPRPVTIDPLVAFGRPVIAGTRVPTAEIAARVGAGESMRDVAEDMRLDPQQVEHAVRFHLKTAA